MKTGDGSPRARPEGDEDSVDMMPAEHDKEQRMIQPQGGERDKAVKILAKSIFRELTMNGFDTRQIVALSTELIGLVTSSMNGKGDPSSESS